MIRMVRARNFVRHTFSLSLVGLEARVIRKTPYLKLDKLKCVGQMDQASDEAAAAAD